MFNIKSDSRRVNKGDIFVALDGIKSNGDCYIQNAIEAGASKIICKNGKYDVETINVDSPKKYLTKYLEDNYNDRKENNTDKYQLKRCFLFCVSNPFYGPKMKPSQKTDR